MPDTEKAQSAAGSAKEKKEIKATSIRNPNVISDRVLSVVAFIITTAYLIGLLLDFIAEGMSYDIFVVQTTAYFLSPMFIALAVAYLMNALATFQGKSWWNLISSVMYIVTMVTLPELWFCVVLQCILTFLSFFRMRNREVKQAEVEDIEAAADAQATPLVNTPNKQMEELVDKKDEEAEAQH